MYPIQYIKLNNFKVFGKEVVINFDNPTVLIGPNNSGKTSIIQILALWHLGIQTWCDKKLKTPKNGQLNSTNSREGVSINRLDIAQIPINDVRFFWNKAIVRHGNTLQPLRVTLGLIHQTTENDTIISKTVDCTVEFKYFKSELLYCYIPPETQQITGLLEQANNLQINLLYPMSGMVTEETLLQEGAIRKQIGQGQTASILRNICYYLYTNQPNDWDTLVKTMQQLFAITLNPPIVKAATADIVLEYNYIHKTQKTDRNLSIMQSGRGQQQVLLLLAFLLWKKNTVLLIDEPDAHLEILRQTQIYELLQTFANQYGNQIIIATHSEAIMNQADQLVFLLDGQATEITDKKNYKQVKIALREIGIEHYYKAKICPRILYIEGSTDKEMLKTFAQKLNHSAAIQLLEDRLFVYYTQNETTNNINLEDKLKQISGNYQNYRKHYQALKTVIPELKAFALFDSDGNSKPTDNTTDLSINYWNYYEIENYFITPQTILAYINQYYTQRYNHKNNQDNNTVTQKVTAFNLFLNQHFLLPLFDNNPQALIDWEKLPQSLQNVQFTNLTSNKKLSTRLETVFEQFATEQNQEIILRKSNFYQLINYANLSNEVTEMLNKLTQHLKS